MLSPDLPFDLSIGLHQTHLFAWRARGDAFETVRSLLRAAIEAGDPAALDARIAERIPEIEHRRRARYLPIRRAQLEETAARLEELGAPAVVLDAPDEVLVLAEWWSRVDELVQLLGARERSSLVRTLLGPVVRRLSRELRDLAPVTWQPAAPAVSWADRVRLALATCLHGEPGAWQVGPGGFVGGPIPHLRWYTCADGPDGSEDVVERAWVRSPLSFLHVARLYPPNGLGGGGIPWFARGAALERIVAVVDQQMPEDAGSWAHHAEEAVGWMRRRVPERLADQDADGLLHHWQTLWPRRRAAFLDSARGALEAGDALVVVEAQGSIFT